MPRPRKPYHLLSESGKRKRDKKVEQESTENAKKEKNRIYMQEYYRAKKAKIMKDQEQKMQASSRNGNNIKEDYNENMKSNLHLNVGSFTSNTCNDHMFSTPTRDGSMPHGFDSVKTPVEVLKERLIESHYLKSIIEEGANTRMRESQLRDEESHKRMRESQLRDEMSRNAEHELKRASYARDEILQELYAEMKKENLPDPSAAVIHETPIKIVESTTRSPPSADENMFDITMAGDEENAAPEQVPFPSNPDRISTFANNSEWKFNIGSAGPSRNKRKGTKGRIDTNIK